MDHLVFDLINKRMDDLKEHISHIRDDADTNFVTLYAKIDSTNRRIEELQKVRWISNGVKIALNTLFTIGVAVLTLYFAMPKK